MVSWTPSTSEFRTSTCVLAMSYLRSGGGGGGTGGPPATGAVAGGGGGNGAVIGGVKYAINSYVPGRTFRISNSPFGLDAAGIAFCTDGGLGVSSKPGSRGARMKVFKPRSTTPVLTFGTASGLSALPEILKSVLV